MYSVHSHPHRGSLAALMRLRARQARPYVRVRRTLAWLPRFTASAHLPCNSGGARLPRPIFSLFLCFFVWFADFLSHDEYFTTSYSTRRFEDLWMHWNKARAAGIAAAALRPNRQRVFMPGMCSSDASLPCPALPCPALPCPALPCPALPCPALPCPALPIPCTVCACTAARLPAAHS